MEHELLRILSILNPVKRPSEAKELLNKIRGTVIDEDSYESWRIAMKCEDCANCESTQN